MWRQLKYLLIQKLIRNSIKLFEFMFQNIKKGWDMPTFLIYFYNDKFIKTNTLHTTYTIVDLLQYGGNEKKNSIFGKRKEKSWCPIIFNYNCASLLFIFYFKCNNAIGDILTWSMRCIIERSFNSVCHHTRTNTFE